MLLRDYHLFFDDPNPLLLRQLKDQLRAGKTKGHTLAVLGCRLKARRNWSASSSSWTAVAPAA